MGNTIYVGNISTQSEFILNKYIDRYMPGATVEPLQPVGLRTRMKNKVPRPDVIMVILEDALYQSCVGVADDVLAMPKVHRYENDEGLKNYLIRRFGKLDDTDICAYVEPEVESADVEENFTGIKESFEDESELKRLRSLLAQREVVVEQLTAQINELGASADNSAFIARIRELEEELEILRNSVEGYKLALKDYESLKASSTSTSRDLESEKDKYTKAQEEISAHAYEITSLKEKIAELQGSVMELEECIENRDDQITELKDAVATMDNLRGSNELLELERKTTQEQQKELSEVRLELENALSEERVAKERLKEQEIKCFEVGERVQVLEEELSEKSALCDEYKEDLDKCRDNAILDSGNIERLSIEIDTLKSERDSFKKTALRVEQLQMELSSKDGTINELSSILSEKEKELDNKSTDLKTLEEISELRQRCTDLELDLLESRDIATELSESIFGQLANIALPKSIMRIDLGVNKVFRDNFYCFASGSHESNFNLYEVLSKTCENVEGSVLIVDLVTDSMIDSEFGVSEVQSPVNWLTGTEGIDNYIKNTKFENTFVTSTALAYMNRTFLLTVDWESRLDSLSGKFDNIIIHVGCLSDLVGYTLFTEFSACMKSHVILEATPINMRTLILSLSGIKERSNITVSCVNAVAYKSDMMKALYQRLSAKSKAQILTDDIIKL